MKRFIVPKETKVLIVSLREKGKSFKDISAELGLQIGTVKAIYYRETPLARKQERKNKRLELINRIANDRLVLTLAEVSKKYGLTYDHISKLTRKHPLSKDFVFDYKKSSIPKRNLKPIDNKDNRKAKQLKDKFESLEGMEKGHVKLQKKENVLPTRSFNVKEQRHIHIPSKNMTISVSKSDTRTNEEIINAFLEKDREYIESCKNNPMNKHSKSYHPIKKQAS